MMKPLTLSLLLLFLAPLSALAQSSYVPSLPTDSRVRELVYDPSDIYTIDTKPGYQTYIEFSPQEEIQTISVGDRSLWQIIPSGHRLFIRPYNVGASTNMAIITNKRTYQFDLNSLPEGSGSAGVIYVARFHYPEAMRNQPSTPLYTDTLPPETEPLPPTVTTPAAPVPLVEPAAPETPYASPVRPAPLSDNVGMERNYQYTYSGPDHIAPTEVYDDGERTYMRPRPPGATPQLYAVDGTGKSTSLTYGIKGDTLIVEHVWPTLLLRQEEDAVYIYNEAYGTR